MRKFLCVLAALGLTFHAVAASAAPPPSDADVRKAIIACYRASGATTLNIQQMHDCSGVWVTPRAALQCIMEAKCQAFGDSLADRGEFFGILQATKLTAASPFVLPFDPDDLPLMPSVGKLTGCQKITKTAKDFSDCVSLTMLPNKYDSLVDCYSKKTDKDRVECFAQQVNNPTLISLLQCVGYDRPTADKLMKCGAVPAIQNAAQGVRDCITAAATPDAKRLCLLKDVPPAYQEMTQCLAGVGTPENAVTCLDRISPEYAKARSAVACLNNPKNSTLQCGEQALTGPAKAAATCLAGAKDSASLFNCASTVDLDLKRTQSVVACVKGSLEVDKLSGCVSGYLGGSDTTKFTTCMGGSPANLEKCLAQLSPQMKTANDTLNCLVKANDGTKVLGCVASQLGAAGGDAVKIAGCISNSGDPMKTAVCLFGNTEQVRAAQAAYTCISESTDAISAVAYCAQALPISDKARETLSCAAHAGGDTSKLTGCAATAVLPPDAARMVSCAANSTGATSFALCAAGPAINEEWRMVAECAVETGGNPIGTAGCAAGGLTLREISKCLTGTVGKDCFGPNNTIVKGLTDAFHDITQGPGQNNEIVKALKTIGDLTGGPHSVINDPAQLTGGPNSMINNPAQIWGGPNSVFNNPSQIWGGPNSVFNNPAQILGGPESLARNPGQIFGGPNSVVNQVATKPLGGNNSVFHCPFGGC